MAPAFSISACASPRATGIFSFSYLWALFIFVFFSSLAFVTFLNA
jgi:hypothetical protein